MLLMMMSNKHYISSSTAGDWVNCGICGEWAHYGCDKRNGLGAFKVILAPLL